MIACARYTSSAVLLGHHPYRGELDDLEGWAARGPGCAVATHGRDVAMVLGSTPARLARWTVPLMPSAPWPTPAATTDLPMMISAYDLATEDGTLVLAYTDQDNVLHLAIESAGTWTEQPAPALRHVARADPRQRCGSTTPGGRDAHARAALRAQLSVTARADPRATIHRRRGGLGGFGGFDGGTCSWNTTWSFCWSTLGANAWQLFGPRSRTHWP